MMQTIAHILMAALYELYDQGVLARPPHEMESLETEVTIESIANLEALGIKEGYDWEVHLLGWIVLVGSCGGKSDMIEAFHAWPVNQSGNCAKCAAQVITSSC